MCESNRMDWRSMFWYDPDKRLVRLVGYKPEHRTEYGAEMFRRRTNYRLWLSDRKSQ